MPAMDPFAGAKDENESQKRDLLGVIAQAGTAGRQEYERAQAQANTMRQGALGAAAQRAQMTGQNLGGMDTAPVTEAADRYNTYFQGQNAGFQNLLGQIGTSADSYLTKVNAIHPFMQSQNTQAAADRENQFRSIMAKAEADRAFQMSENEKERQHAIEMAKLNASLRPKTGAEGGGSAGGGNINTMTSAQYKKSLSPAAQRILPGGQKLDNLFAKIQLDTGNILGSALPDRSVPPMFDKNWVMQNVIMPGTNKKATSSRADDVMKAPELNQAYDFMVDMMSVPTDQNGMIVENDIIDLTGITKREAFEKYIDSLPGIRTMKEALKQYYGPVLDQR